MENFNFRDPPLPRAVKAGALFGYLCLLGVTGFRVHTTLHDHTKYEQAKTTAATILPPPRGGYILNPYHDPSKKPSHVATNIDEYEKVLSQPDIAHDKYIRDLHPTEILVCVDAAALVGLAFVVTREEST